MTAEPKLAVKKKNKKKRVSDSADDEESVRHGMVEIDLVVPASGLSIAEAGMKGFFWEVEKKKSAFGRVQTKKLLPARTRHRPKSVRLPAEDDE